jgi:hypothetical protein
MQLYCVSSHHCSGALLSVLVVRVRHGVVGNADVNHHQQSLHAIGRVQPEPTPRSRLSQRSDHGSLLHCISVIMSKKKEAAPVRFVVIALACIAFLLKFKFGGLFALFLVASWKLVHEVSDRAVLSDSFLRPRKFPVRCDRSAPFSAARPTM